MNYEVVIQREERVERRKLEGIDTIEVKGGFIIFYKGEDGFVEQFPYRIYSSHWVVSVIRLDEGG